MREIMIERENELQIQWQKNKLEISTFFPIYKQIQIISKPRCLTENQN